MAHTFNPIKHTKQLERHVTVSDKNYKIVVPSELTDELLRSAKLLHASIYLERAYIDRADIGPDGYMHLAADPHQAHSDYFVMRDENESTRAVATARQIRANGSHAHLPIMEKAQLNVKHQSFIKTIPPDSIVEISGLTKAHGAPFSAVLELYIAMWVHSIDKRHKLWLMACDVQLYHRLRILFGKAMVKIGKQTHYKGGDIIPCMLELDKSQTRLLENLKSRHILYGKVRRDMARRFLEARNRKIE